MNASIFLFLTVSFLSLASKSQDEDVSAGLVETFDVTKKGKLIFGDSQELEFKLLSSLKNASTTYDWRGKKRKRCIKDYFQLSA